MGIFDDLSGAFGLGGASSPPQGLNSDVSLTNIDPQIAALQRRQKLAEALAKQGQEPIEPQSYKGIQAPISPYAALARALQQFAGNYFGEKASQKQQELSSQARGDAANATKDIFFKPYTPATDYNSTAWGGQGSDTPTPSEVGKVDVTPRVGSDVRKSDDEQLVAALKQANSDNPYTRQMASTVLPGIQASNARANEPYTLGPGQERNIGDQTIASAPTLPDYGERGQGINPDTGQPDTYVIDKKTAAKQWEGITPVPKTAPTRAPTELEKYQTALKDLDPQSPEAKQINGAIQKLTERAPNNAGWNVVLDPETHQPYRYNAGTGQATTLDGKTPIQPSGYEKPSSFQPRSPVGIYMKQYQTEHPKADAAELATAMNMFHGQQAEQGALGTIGAKIGSANNGLDLVLDQSNAAYSKLPRSQFVPFNALMKMAQTDAFASPEQADAYAADTGAINMWAKSINPSGQLTVENARRGEQMLSNATSPEAHQAVIERMRKEGAAAVAGVAKSRGTAAAAGTQITNSAPRAGAPAAPAQPAAPRTVHFNDLPK